jgi:hypothetical protein
MGNGNLTTILAALLFAAGVGGFAGIVAGAHTAQPRLSSADCMSIERDAAEHVRAMMAQNPTMALALQRRGKANVSFTQTDVAEGGQKIPETVNVTAGVSGSNLDVKTTVTPSGGSPSVCEANVPLQSYALGSNSEF